MSIDLEVIKQYQNIFGEKKMFLLWKEFVNDAKKKLNKIENKEKEKQRLAYHSLQSSSQIFGCKKFAKLCKVYEEQAVRGENISKDEANVSRNMLAECIKEVDAYMNNLIQNNNKQRLNKKLPAYLKEVYSKFYNNEVWCRWADKQWVRNLLSFGYDKKLIESVLDEIRRGNKVLQLGATFGNQIDDTALRISKLGKFDIVDISSAQIRRCKNKYGNLYPQLRFIYQNANISTDDSYDVVIVYMLLSEVPNHQKSKILQAAMDSLQDNGKVVIVDYHNPSKWNIWRFAVKMFNRLYHPFAEALWEKEITGWIKSKATYSFRRNLYFGKMYQKLVIKKKTIHKNIHKDETVNHKSVTKNSN